MDNGPGLTVFHVWSCCAFMCRRGTPMIVEEAYHSRARRGRMGRAPGLRSLLLGRNRGAERCGQVHLQGCGPLHAEGSCRCVRASTHRFEALLGDRLRTGNLVEQVQFFSGFEPDSASGSNGHFRPGSGIASDPGFARFYAENPKSAQFDTVAGGKGILHAEEHCIHGSLSLDPR